jgi:hypothetical protein
MPPKRTSPLAEHFWSKVDRSGDCWLWLASRRPNGYGTYYVDRVPMLAHRIAWELTYGSIPQGLFVCHSCDTPACVRPDHLLLGSARANLLDARRKGRAPVATPRPKTGLLRGEQNPAARLTVNSLVEIRRRVAVGTEPYATIAAAFGVSRSLVYQLAHRKVWRHVA